MAVCYPAIPSQASRITPSPITRFRRVMAGLPRHRKGSTPGRNNRKLHEGHKDDAIQAKKSQGKWLPKEQYEATTGKPGKK